MEAELGLRPEQLNLCVSIFFLTYLLFEVPSNMALPALLLATVVLLMLPDYPQTASSFLNSREMQIAVLRLPSSAPSPDVSFWNSAEFWAIVKDPMNIAFPLANLKRHAVADEWTGLLQPQILKDMGFGGTMANLMSAWPNVWGGLFEIFMAIHGDLNRERTWHIVAPGVLSLLGYLLLPWSAKRGWPLAARYAVTFLAASGIAVAPPWYAFRQSLLIGATSHALGLAWLNVFINLGSGCWIVSTGSVVLIITMVNREERRRKYRGASGTIDGLEMM
ncbi:hypothetical protein HDU93_008823 [Gonapodya sp. JEL0774]|nr:hypothetical protein HDU93_008823 [Gonapodya sp. JEL0774]